MKAGSDYTDEPLGDIKVVDDFLPPPKELVIKEENVKVTLGFTKLNEVWIFSRKKRRNITPNIKS